ncbi:DUF2770 family protein [Escherichia coli]
MRRLLHYLINNIREHLMLYLFLWEIVGNYGSDLCVLFLVFRTDIN